MHSPDQELCPVNLSQITWLVLEAEPCQVKDYYIGCHVGSSYGNSCLMSFLIETLENPSHLPFLSEICADELYCLRDHIACSSQITRIASLSSYEAAFLAATTLVVYTVIMENTIWHLKEDKEI
eukprot:7560891-Ditylum_brightwellii.AAC.1